MLKLLFAAIFFIGTCCLMVENVSAEGYFCAVKCQENPKKICMTTFFRDGNVFKEKNKKDTVFKIKEDNRFLILTRSYLANSMVPDAFVVIIAKEQLKGYYSRVGKTIYAGSGKCMKMQGFGLPK